MEPMKDAKFMSAKEKEIVLKAWERFMRGLAGGKAGEELSRIFTEALYHHLIQHCSFIAHYNRGGFFQHYFDRQEMTLKFLSQFDGRGPCLSVEYGMDYWIRRGNDVCREYYDINAEMVRIAMGFIPGIQERLGKSQETRDLALAKALLGKHGFSLEIGNKQAAGIKNRTLDGGAR